MIPHEIIITPLRVDMYIASRSTKVAIFIELTCPNDENIRIRCKEKNNKYAELAITQKDGWKIHILTVVVGSKGFINKDSFSNLAVKLGLDNKNRNLLKCSLSKMSLRCSYVIWINRYNKIMDYYRLKKCDIPAEMWYHSSVPWSVNSGKSIVDGSSGIYMESANLLLSFSPKVALKRRKKRKKLEY